MTDTDRSVTRFLCLQQQRNGQIPLRYLASEMAGELVRELVCDQLSSWIA